MGQPLRKNLRGTHENLAKPLESSSHVAKNQNFFPNFRIWGCFSNISELEPVRLFKWLSNGFQMAMETAIYSSKHILPVVSWTHTLDSVQCSKWFYNSRLSLHSCHCMAVTAWLFCMATMATAASNMKTRLGTDMYMLCLSNNAACGCI